MQYLFVSRPSGSMVEHQSSELKVAGSSPLSVNLLSFRLWSLSKAIVSLPNFYIPPLIVSMVLQEMLPTSRCPLVEGLLPCWEGRWSWTSRAPRRRDASNVPSWRCPDGSPVLSCTNGVRGGRGRGRLIRGRISPRRRFRLSGRKVLGQARTPPRFLVRSVSNRARAPSLSASTEPRRLVPSPTTPSIHHHVPWTCARYGWRRTTIKFLLEAKPWPLTSWKITSWWWLPFVPCTVQETRMVMIMMMVLTKFVYQIYLYMHTKTMILVTAVTFTYMS